jgi:hypothetical protein
VARGGSLKLAHLRRDPRATVVVRSGWQWAAVEGHADLVGPDDAFAGFDAADLRRCCATSSGPRAAPTTTGTSTTA